MILILGSNGYVGKALREYLHKEEVPFTTLSARFPLDEERLKEEIIKNKATAIINCSGFTGKPNVDECEKEGVKQECLFANALFPAAVAKICDSLGIKFVHVSSGCIFTDPRCDSGSTPFIQFTEDSEPNFTFEKGNCSWYSGTKALGESLVKQADPRAVIARLRIPFNGDLNPRNYISKLIKYPKLLNATNSFSQLDEFVKTLHTLAESYISGPINLTQPGYMTTIEVVRLLQKYHLVTTKEWFESVDHFNSTVAAPRSNCVLDCSEAIRSGFELTHINQAMEEAISKYAYNLTKQ